MALTSTAERWIRNALPALQIEAHDNSRAHGFWDECLHRKYTPSDGRLHPDGVMAAVPMKLALIHSEVSECLHAWQKSAPEKVKMDIGDELADTIGILHRGHLREVASADDLRSVTGKGGLESLFAQDREEDASHAETSAP